MTEGTTLSRAGSGEDTVESRSKSAKDSSEGVSMVPNESASSCGVVKEATGSMGLTLSIFITRLTLLQFALFRISSMQEESTYILLCYKVVRPHFRDMALTSFSLPFAFLVGVSGWCLGSLCFGLQSRLWQELFEVFQ